MWATPTNLTSVIKVERLFLRRALLQARRYLQRMQRGLHSPEAEVCVSLARQRKEVACQRGVPSRQLSSQVGPDAGKYKSKTLDGWFEGDFRTGSGFNPGAQWCPDLGLPMFLCWRARGNLGLSKPERKSLFSFQPQGKSSLLLSCTVLGYLGEGRHGFSAVFSPGGWKPHPTSPKKLTLP